MKERITHIRDRVRAAAMAAGRDPSEIRLVAAAKTMPAQTVAQAIKNGADIIGENYIQEARDKSAALTHMKASWHFIGRLQTNKAKYAARIFDLIHSVDSVKLAREIDKQAGKIGKTQRILIQVNIAGEASKSGVSPQEAPGLIREIAWFENLSARGLMTMPPFFDDGERARPFFAALSRLRDEIAAQDIPGVSMEELSMGMTGDFEAAIQEGATLVRIGTAIFGPRA
ncbi:Pyridoxal phosphate homeostasis protein [Candidatus Desulfarcum epimagneticum]|uniref:Pyridoxal phosphate homeostasis protein n=1 Tax=uncultured Desulfobacteraceae bacterium TaxID=218296 RepID=A0A484HG39_9BACT|nr:Pyridoxal phosphate homeostasis protein [uncultured Desulfobacteraceae bacterium]